MKSLCLMFSLFSVTLLAEDKIGEVTVFDGNAVVFADFNPAKKSVELNSKIFLKDIIRTGTNNSLQIFFKDVITCCVGENTEIAIEEYRYINDKKNDSEFNVNLRTGKMHINSDEIAEIKPQSFNIITKHATIGVNGGIVDGQSTEQMDEVTVQEIEQNGSIAIVTKNNERYVFIKPGKLILNENGRSIRQDIDACARSTMMRDFLGNPINDFDKQEEVQKFKQYKIIDKSPTENDIFFINSLKNNKIYTNPIK